MCVYYADRMIALLFPKLHTKNKLEMQLSQQQSWTWRRAGGSVQKHTSHSKPRHHYALQPKPYSNPKDPSFGGKEKRDKLPSTAEKAGFRLLKCLCKHVHQQTCLLHRGKEECEQWPGR